MSSSFWGLNSGHLLKNSLSADTKCCSSTTSTTDKSTFVPKFILIFFSNPFRLKNEAHSSKVCKRLASNVKRTFQCFWGGTKEKWNACAVEHEKMRNIGVETKRFLHLFIWYSWKTCRALRRTTKCYKYWQQFVTKRNPRDFCGIRNSDRQSLVTDLMPRSGLKYRLGCSTNYASDSWRLIKAG